MNLKDDFEEVFNSLYSLVSGLAEVSSQIVRRFLIILTSPLWFLPYLIIKDVIIPSLRETEGDPKMKKEETADESEG
jgi:hypothetical protein